MRPLQGAASRRGVAQPGRAPGSGPGGRRFKSSLPDQLLQALGTNSVAHVLGVIRTTGNCCSENMWNQGQLARSCLPVSKHP